MHTSKYSYIQKCSILPTQYTSHTHIDIYIYIHVHIRKYIYICRSTRLRQPSMRVTVLRCHASVYSPPATLQHSRQISGASLTTATAIYRGIVDLPMTGSNITPIIVDLPVTTAIEVRPVIKMPGASTVGST